MKQIDNKDLFDVCESSLLCDLVMERYISIGEKDTVKPIFTELIEKINNLTRGA